MRFRYLAKNIVKCSRSDPNVLGIVAPRFYAFRQTIDLDNASKLIVPCTHAACKCKFRQIVDLIAQLSFLLLFFYENAGPRNVCSTDYRRFCSCEQSTKFFGTRYRRWGRTSQTQVKRWVAPMAYNTDPTISNRDTAVEYPIKSPSGQARVAALIPVTLFFLIWDAIRSHATAGV